MGSPFSTIRAGSAALGISFVVASATWQSVLLLFTATGLGFSVWSVIKDKREKKPSTDKQNTVKLSSRRRRPFDDYEVTNSNVYQLRYPLPKAAPTEY